MAGSAQKLKSFSVQSLRVWRILRKPTREEFLLISKVSAIGILALGLIGFIISELIGIIS